MDLEPNEPNLVPPGHGERAGELFPSEPRCRCGLSIDPRARECGGCGREVRLEVVGSSRGS